MIEVALPEELALEALRRVGAEPLPGFESVPVDDPETGERHLVITVRCFSDTVLRAVEALSGVVRVYAEPKVEPFGGHGTF